MKVLVTGHLGFIGPVVIRLLKQAGYQAYGFDTGYFRDCVTEEAGWPAPDGEIVKDVRDAEAGDFAGYDALVHLAALSNDPMGQLNPALTHAINHQASVRIATLAKQAGVGRFVFASSCSLYGAADGSEALTETAAFNPVSAYARSKVATEQDVSRLADATFSPIFLRNATAYGVSPRIRFDLVLNNLMGWARTTGEIRVLSDGTPWRPLVHIEDIGRAVLSALTAPRETVHNEAFNIGHTDANYQVRNIAEAVAHQVPGATLLITGETSNDLRSYRVDFTKALTRLPGFEPRWTLERGAEELDRWFTDHPSTVESFQTRMFIRLKQLQHLLDRGSLDGNLRWRVPS